MKEELLSRLEHVLLGYGVQAGHKIVVAVSGGPDSVCLLYLLHHISLEHHFSLHIAHLNHLFRSEAKDEARFVFGLAEQWRIPLTSSESHVADFCAEHKIGKQLGARIKRYEFLEATRLSIKADWIALGHNADDQSETLLMRILRGSGPAGLSGIPEIRGLHIIRPLLGTTRREILTCLSDENIHFKEDPSNQSTLYLRNKIRHTIFPQLEEINPNIKATLRRDSEILKCEDDFVMQSLLEIIPTLGIREKKEELRVELKPFHKIHPALQRRFLRWALQTIKAPMQEIGFAHIENLRSYLREGRPGKKIQLPHGTWLTKENTHFTLHPDLTRSVDKTDHISPPSLRLLKMDLKQEKTHHYEFPDWHLQLKCRITNKLKWDKQQHNLPSKYAASFDLEHIEQPIGLRSWLPGDRFCPSGMKGRSKKLQDFFVDIKVPRSERSKVPLLFCAKGIFWIPGYRTDERFIVKETSKHILTINAHFA